MATIEALGEGICIAKKIYFGEGTEDKHLCLAKKLGESMRYDRSKQIDFPGEYEVDDISIVATTDKNDTLNYVIDFGNKKYTIVQSKRFLQSDECPEECAQRIFLAPGLKDKATQNEYEGGFVDVSGDEWVTGKLGMAVEE